TLDLDIRPQNKTLRVFTLRSPLYARGTFKNPDVGVQAGPVAARAGAAVALGVIAAPLAALVPLLNVGTDEDSACSTVRDGGRDGAARKDAATRGDAAAGKEKRGASDAADRRNDAIFENQVLP